MSSQSVIRFYKILVTREMKLGAVLSLSCMMWGDLHTEGPLVRGEVGIGGESTGSYGSNMINLKGLG